MLHLLIFAHFTWFADLYQTEFDVYVREMHDIMGNLAALPSNSYWPNVDRLGIMVHSLPTYGTVRRRVASDRCACCTRSPCVSVI